MLCLFCQVIKLAHFTQIHSIICINRIWEGKILYQLRSSYINQNFVSYISQNFAALLIKLNCKHL